MTEITEREFVTTCVHLTGFSDFDLYATGMAARFRDTARTQVGPDRFATFWAALKDALAQPKGMETLSPTHLEVARALTYMWYTGAWPRLATAAHADLRREMANTEFVVAPAAYVESLVWRTFDGHPAGAKPPGFGTWAVRPPGAMGFAISRSEREREDATAVAGAGDGAMYRTGLPGPVALDAFPAELLPAFRPEGGTPPSAIPTAAAPVHKEASA